jgi:hypothetical protein
MAGQLRAESYAAQRSCFKVYDATLFKSRPDLKTVGLERASVFDITQAIDASQVKGDIPNETSIKTWLSRRPSVSKLVVLDVEHLPLTGDPLVVEKSVEKFRDLLARTRRVLPDRTIGYYAVPPIRDYWRATDSTTSRRFKTWQAENDKWQTLADDVDAIFPSLYTFYDDESGWVRYAKANLIEARRLAPNKPIYPLIWPQYHESNNRLAGTLIPGTFWRVQLDTIARYADGVVIWGGYQLKWNEQASWWQATRQFMQDNDCRVPGAPQNVRMDAQ